MRPNRFGGGYGLAKIGVKTAVNDRGDHAENNREQRFERCDCAGGFRGGVLHQVSHYRGAEKGDHHAVKEENDNDIGNGYVQMKGRQGGCPTEKGHGADDADASCREAVDEISAEAVKQGKAQYIPISIVQVPNLIKKDMVPIDVALIQVSLPDEHGFVSLGVSVDITKAAVLKAKTVIAGVNPNMPYTFGDSLIPIDRIDYLVPVDTPVIEYLHKPADDIAKQIARYVARIINDNSTLHIGLGRIPNEMLKYLTNRKNLGIRSDVITEPVMEAHGVSI